jgi:hypothetical protein
MGPIHEQFVIEARVVKDGLKDETEIVGIRCRWCQFQIMSGDAAKAIIKEHGYPALLLAVGVQGGIHWLLCQGPKKEGAV